MQERKLKIVEAAQYLGVAHDTVRRWIKAGRLPAYKPGNAYLLRESDLDAFLEANKINGKDRTCSTS